MAVKRTRKPAAIKAEDVQAQNEAEHERIEAIRASNPPPPEREPVMAIVRGGEAVITGPKSVLNHFLMPGDRAMIYRGPKAAGYFANFVDEELQEVRAIGRGEAKTQAEEAAFVRQQRLASYPPVHEQVGAILKQLEKMTKAGERHPELQAVLDRVAEVKTALDLP